MVKMTRERRAKIRSWNKKPTFRRGTGYLRALQMLSKGDILTLKQLNERNSLDTPEAIQTCIENEFPVARRYKGEACQRLNYYLAKAGKRRLTKWDKMGMSFNPDETYKELKNIVYVKYPWSDHLYTEQIGKHREDKGEIVSIEVGLKEARKEYRRYCKYYKDLMTKIITGVQTGEFKYKSSYADYNLGITLSVLWEQGYIEKPAKGQYRITKKGLMILNKKK